MSTCALFGFEVNLSIIEDCNVKILMKNLFELKNQEKSVEPC